MKRRDFIKTLTTGALLASAPSLFASTQKTSTILYSAGSDLEGNFNICAYAVGELNKLLFKTSLPARAHGVTVRNTHNEIIVFARRPNDFMLVLDAQTGVAKQTIKNDKPLFGHGVFTPDGKTLFTTENDFENKLGIIGVRDATDNYKKIAEFSSGGIGPHELHLLADGKTLVVANGGILTHPETGRAKLNLETMTPALTYIDTQSSKVIDDYRLDKKYHQLSIRHLDVTQDDQVCFVMQYQGSRRHQVPLVGFHKGQSQLQLAEIPKVILPKMKNYCGSVSADASGKTFAVSSPRGNLMTLWNANGNFIDSFDLMDGCGVAVGNKANEFFFSNGGGDLHQYTLQKDLLLSKNTNQRWDNHLTAWNQS
ncbi:MAG: DUF1513 domain-containing protein [Cocleimonas sp.]|nr:DUF1513 domain-containing protein [Cocleimonas sp.]